MQNNLFHCPAMADAREFPIIEKLGGRTAVFELLRDRGIIETEAALRMQTTRGSMSADTLRALMAYAEERGVAYFASDFVLPAEAA